MGDDPIRLDRKHSLDRMLAHDKPRPSLEEFSTMTVTTC
jgi:hypothetical protein